MAAKIRGITIEIGGDTSGLDKALKSTNSQIKSTQSQLKDVEKLLKLDPSSTELLAQKQKLLQDAVTQTSDKLATLKQAEEELQKAGVDKNSEQFMALEREIISTENSLKKAKEQADGFSVSLEKAKNAASKVSSAASEVANKTKGLSTAAAGLLTGLAGAAVNAAVMSDDLNTLAKQSGLATDELQKFNYAQDLVDVSSEDMISALKKMKKNMASTSSQVTESFEQIGVAVVDANGEYRDSTEVFYETLEALSKVSNETERDVLAMNIFGKSADNLAGIIDDGGKALKELGDQAEEAGLILSQETLDSLNEVNDKIDTMKATITGTLSVAGSKALTALEPVFNTIINKIQNLLTWVGSLDANTMKTIATVLAVIAAISPVAGIIAKISGAVGTVLTIWPKVQAALTAVTSFAAANPIVLIVAAIAGLAAVVVSNWETIKPVLDNIWAKVKDIFDKIKNKVQSVMDAIKAAVKTAINSVISVINGLINGINKLIAGINKIKFDIPSWVPAIGGKSLGFNIPQINKIPMLANGGDVLQGSALVGERGPELLTMNNGIASITPLFSGITSQLGDIRSAMNGYPSTIVVQSVLDGKVIGQTAYNFSSSQARVFGR